MCACVIEFNLEFQGKSAHGARPYLGHDTILCASQFVSECYSLIPRKIDARVPHVITFGAISGGTRSNIIAESCMLKATIRAFNTETARKVLEEAKRVAEGICIIHETTYKLDILLDLPAVVTDPYIADCVKKGAISILGNENVVKDFPTSLGGEDFGVYLEHLKGGMFRLGVASPGKDAPALHAQNFDVYEEVIAVGVKVLVNSVLEMIAKN
jgi:amidohydrolase